MLLATWFPHCTLNHVYKADPFWIPEADLYFMSGDESHLQCCSHSLNKSRLTKAKLMVWDIGEYCSVSMFLCSGYRV